MHGVHEGGWSGLQFDFPGICGRSLVPRLRNSTQIRIGTRLSWPRIHGARIRVQSVSAGHAHSTGIVPRRWNKVWERRVSVPWTSLVRNVYWCGVILLYLLYWLQCSQKVPPVAKIWSRVIRMPRALPMCSKTVWREKMSKALNSVVS